MIPTALIAFREFLEAFLIVGVFWGISRKLSLGKEKEIGFAASIGFALAFSMAMVTYLFGDTARIVLTEENAEILESYLQIFSGLFLAYVIFSLHKVLHASKMAVIKDATKRLREKAFDVSLFATVLFLVAREGFEIALFTASTSLFAVFFQNVIGLIGGFLGAAVIGVGTSLAYIKFPVQKVFRITEYLIILLGAALVQHGITELLEIYWHIEISEILPMHMSFLSDSHSIIGHAIQTFTGIDQQFSGARLGIMVGYIVGVYILFIKKNSLSSRVK